MSVLSDQSTKGTRLTQGIILGSALLAAIWYIINIPYDLSTKVLPKHSDSADLHSNKSSSDPDPPIKGVHDIQETKKQSSITNKEVPETRLPVDGPLARYENVSLLRNEGKRQAAIFLWEDGTNDSLLSLESVVADSLANHGIKPVQSFFTPEFVREGKASRLMAGDWKVARNLELGRHVDYVLIGSIKISYEPNDNFAGLLTANLSLELKCLDAVIATVCGVQRFAVPGAGYNRQAALTSAIDHIKPEMESSIRGWIR